ncbi:g1 s-specific cyclin [Grosmannia clavigera kw1407]|uniref:G1 s-specific cyclin n=1 Tax=Grosmannia clavigera (strain kw1407 / UAMH 11150) TaxID=655863 RepID=F0XTC4_GROCL|nr:g1 s-specific cyclin [Grosmannia clavigera kw1407]EFW99171.1 g1 s-specific cyclin [Grosmannia clavigera kw1407]
MQGDDDSYASPLALPQHPRLRHSTLPYSSSLASRLRAALTAATLRSQIDRSLRQHSLGRSNSSSRFLASCDRTLVEPAPHLPPYRPFFGNLIAEPPLSIILSIVQAIWPLSSVIGRGESASSGSGSSSNGSYLLPLRTFIQETLRRSRASYSTLQVALYYLLLIKPRLPGHNFTMEQPSDSYACRALQCGRRMFLAALILASKYLQDRNYSARAWSKISGLATAEINQNETAFLHAVDWRLHITNDVYNRWIDCVNRFNPPQLPPSPGPETVKCFELKCEEFRLLIQKLTPSLENLDELCLPSTSIAIRRRSSCHVTTGNLSPMSFCSSPEVSSLSSTDVTPTATSNVIGAVPIVLEPRPLTPAAFTTAPQALALGLMPMPRLALPQPSTFGAPVPGAMAQMLGGNRSSMGFAVAQASNNGSTHFLDRWPGSLTSSTSPVGSVPVRRSSLANSVSTASSPESMISDSSLVSRCSSNSSSWPSMIAPSTQLPKLEAQARHRYAKHQCSGSSLRDKSMLLRPTVIPVVHEDEEVCRYATPVFASPEMSYTVPMGKEANEIQLPLDRRSSDVDAADAARALAELQQQTMSDMQFSAHPQRPRSALKRSRPLSVDNSLQDNVRELLRETTMKLETKNAIPEPFSLPAVSQLVDLNANVPVVDRAAALTGSRKRLCRTSAAVTPRAVKPRSFNTDLQHPTMSGLYGPGMWEGLV